MSVAVTLAPATATLHVADSGAEIPAGLAAQLFDAPVTSGAGLGVGLYHAAKQAAQAGYTLSLTENRHGNVRFSWASTVHHKTLNTFNIKYL